MAKELTFSQFRNELIYRVMIGCGHAFACVAAAHLADTDVEKTRR